jgi:hypothetical protein
MVGDAKYLAGCGGAGDVGVVSGGDKDRSGSGQWNARLIGTRTHRQSRETFELNDSRHRTAGLLQIEKRSGYLITSFEGSMAQSSLGLYLFA